MRELLWRRSMDRTENAKLSNRPIRLDKSGVMELKEKSFFQPLAAREGLEPPTFALGKRCSILLSYRADRWG